MIVTLSQLIPGEEAQAIARALDGEAFVSGDVSAGNTARYVKNNQELSSTSEAGKRHRAELNRKLWQNQLFLNLAMPKRIVECIFSRYEVGMAYGDHIDNTIMQMTTGDPVRADLSMTLFLEDPSTYDGGELIINSDTAPQKVKLPAGDAVLYPTTNYHRVAPVTRGTRRVAVFWIQSMVRDAEQRQILTEIWMATEWLYRQAAPGRAQEDETFEILKKARANLYRMWAEV